MGRGRNSSALSPETPIVTEMGDFVLGLSGLMWGGGEGLLELVDGLLDTE